MSQSASHHFVVYLWIGRRRLLLLFQDGGGTELTSNSSRDRRDWCCRSLPATLEPRRHTTTLSISAQDWFTANTVNNLFTVMETEPGRGYYWINCSRSSSDRNSDLQLLHICPSDTVCFFSRRRVWRGFLITEHPHKSLKPNISIIFFSLLLVRWEV